MKKKIDKGIVITFTGNGKGKTTAALGVSLRAAGHGMKTLMIQFIKEKGKSGEQNICPSFLQSVEIYPFGIGFIFRGDDPRPHMEIAEQAWIFMEERLKQKKYQLLVLDEIAVVLNLGLLPLEKITNFLRKRDDELHVILTGRDMPAEIERMSDIVTEMREVKHHFRDGTPATKGLDF
jgi:cob(I)alamin adenosyltransferase